MSIPIYWIDAFTDRAFGGNPAAVCPLNEWLPDDTMQQIAAQNGLSETAFFVWKSGEAFPLRWFTPLAEVDLCGHATLATAAVVFRLEPNLTKIEFSSKSGPLGVQRDDDFYALDFPASRTDLCLPPQGLLEGLGEITPVAILRDERYYLVELEDEKAVRELQPELGWFMNLDRHGVIVTAKGDEADFVSRFFAPSIGVPEDPVTGSAHCALVPYWFGKTEQRSFHARQISARGGELFCEYLGGRVTIAGNARLYLEGSISI